jgi:Cof subfamily protein (haloacid dehalogenase superfamily)
MDGTLLNRKREISECNKETIRKAHEKGIHVVVSTGRLFTNAEEFSKLIGVKSPVIASNGAVIRGIDKKQIIDKAYLDTRACITLLDILKRYKLNPYFSTPEKSYTGDLKYKILLEHAKRRDEVIRKTKLEYVPFYTKWIKIFEAEKDNIVKCEIKCRHANKLESIRKELEELKEFDMVRFSYRNIEITKKDVSKGKAVKKLAEYYGIKREEIIAIGDSENDLSMIKYAGVGIAMGNAMEIVKKNADYITDTNDNDGVAKAIIKYVFKDEEEYICKIL